LDWIGTELDWRWIGTDGPRSHLTPTRAYASQAKNLQLQLQITLESKPPSKKEEEERRRSLIKLVKCDSTIQNNAKYLVPGVPGRVEVEG
jgi:hypothetical protein